MLPARLARLEFDAKKTAREISDRREVLDWHLNARRELEQHKAAMAAEEERAKLMSGSDGEAGRQGSKGSALVGSRSASRLDTEVMPSSSAPSKLGRMANSASTPSLGMKRDPPDLPLRRSISSSMTVQRAPGMRDRLDKLCANAQRNAKEISERRTVLDGFKELKAVSASKDQSAMSMDIPRGTILPTAHRVTSLSYNSRSSFAENFSLKPLESAVKVIPPPERAIPTSSMRNRLEACEHRVLWNHQTMTHNQKFLDEYRSFATG